MLMCDKDMIGAYDSLATMKKIKVSPDEIVVIKLSANTFCIEEARAIFDSVKQELPEKTPLMLLPCDVELDVEQIDYMIKYLQEIKQNDCILR